MSELMLDFDEEILLEKVGNITRYSGNNEQLDIEEFYLTNKNIVYVYKQRIKGIIPKFEDIVEKIPLVSIKIINGDVQVSVTKDFTHGRTLQIQYTNRKKELFNLGISKKEYDRWETEISVTALSCKYIDNNQNVNAANERQNDSKTNYNDYKETSYNSENNSQTGSYIFCTSCGTRLDSGAKFCVNCGTPTTDEYKVPTGDESPRRNDEHIRTEAHSCQSTYYETNKSKTTLSKNDDSEVLKETKTEETEPTTSDADDVSFGAFTERKTVYEGKLHKCPNCGEVLPAFSSKCSACGYEIRDIDGSKTVYEFTLKLEKIKSDEQRISLIRNYPIANSKEDIFEFMILASTNIVNETNESIISAWIAKVEQCYKKASLLFDDNSDLEKIKKLYNECQDILVKIKHRKKVKHTCDLVVRNIAILAALIMIIVSIVIDTTDGNPALIELVAVIIIIASSTSLVKRSAGLLDFGIGILSGLIMIGLSFLLSNGSLIQLGGGIVLIIVAINFTKSLSRKYKNKG